MQANPFPPTIPNLERQWQALAAFDSSTWLSQLTLPVTIVAHDEDIISPIVDSLFLVKAIPGARLITLPGAHAISTLDQAVWQEIN